MINELVEPWRPSPAQMMKFLDREVALCRAAIRRDPSLRQAHTLYSNATWNRAVALAADA